ncbi:MAG: winged helix-turn-helix transcriptional regulator [Bacteroidetes bacterium]|nr:winged helix-turn-helix transcriptional regulator [Bacteroidota bacterium]
MRKTQYELRSNILAALAHPNRIRILEFLQDGVKCNCEIAPALDLEQSNLSRHMKILVQEGVVISWKDGLRVNYKVADERIFDILSLAGKVSHSEAKIRVELFEEV